MEGSPHPILGPVSDQPILFRPQNCFRPIVFARQEIRTSTSAETLNSSPKTPACEVPIPSQYDLPICQAYNQPACHRLSAAATEPSSLSASQPPSLFSSQAEKPKPSKRPHSSAKLPRPAPVKIRKPPSMTPLPTNVAKVGGHLRKKVISHRYTKRVTKDARTLNKVNRVRLFWSRASQAIPNVFKLLAPIPGEPSCIEVADFSLKEVLADEVETPPHDNDEFS